MAVRSSSQHQADEARPVATRTAVDNDAPRRSPCNGRHRRATPLRLIVEEGAVGERAAIEVVAPAVLPDPGIGVVVQRHMHGRQPCWADRDIRQGQAKKPRQHMVVLAHFWCSRAEGQAA